MTDLDPMLGPLDGGHIPGGCEHCDAYQVPRKLADRMWNITVYHDDDCPFLARIQARRQA